jgi:hypothetical protein
MQRTNSSQQPHGMPPHNASLHYTAGCAPAPCHLVCSSQCAARPRLTSVVPRDIFKDTLMHVIYPSVPCRTVCSSRCAARPPSTSMWATCATAWSHQRHWSRCWKRCRCGWTCFVTLYIRHPSLPLLHVCIRGAGQGAGGAAGALPFAVIPCTLINS